MELLKNLELVEVTTNDGKATLTFLHEERGEIREVNFNKNVYDESTGKFTPDADKAAKVEEWCQEYFKLTFDKLSQAIGTRKDVYAYDTFNSLWESEQIKKFEKDMVGQIIQTEIKEITDDGVGIHIKFDYEDETYQSNMSYSEYMENLKKWFKNPQKQAKQYKKFEEKFHVGVAEAIETGCLTGQEIMVEVKSAFGKFVYPEIKPLLKKK